MGTKTPSLSQFLAALGMATAPGLSSLAASYGRRMCLLASLSAWSAFSAHPAFCIEDDGYKTVIGLVTGVGAQGISRDAESRVCQKSHQGGLHQQSVNVESVLTADSTGSGGFRGDAGATAGGEPPGDHQALPGPRGFVKASWTLLHKPRPRRGGEGKAPGQLPIRQKYIDL